MQTSLEVGKLESLLWELLRGDHSEPIAGDRLALWIVAAYHAGLPHRAAEIAQRWAKVSQQHLATGPLVSIVIPTFNRRHLLRRTLASVCAQLYRPLEVIVVNDAGADVRDIVAPFAESLPIQRIEHDRNQYLAASRNSGAAAADGHAILFLDDDDELYPHHIGHLVWLLGSRRARAGRTSSLRRQPIPGHVGRYGYARHPWRAFRLAELLEENVTPVQTVLLERELLEQVGPFDTTLLANEDWDLWIRVARATEVAESQVVTSCVDTTGSGRMTDRSQQAFEAAHRTIHSRYADLVDQHGGDSLRKRQVGVQQWVASRPAHAQEQSDATEPATIVLNYHRIVDDPTNDPFQLSVSVENFMRQLDWLERSHRIISAEEFLHGAKGDDGRQRVLLTFDDGYRDNYTQVWPLLRCRQLPAVLFVTTSAIDGELPFWWEILAAAGRLEQQEAWKRLPPSTRQRQAAELLATLPNQERERLANLSCRQEMLKEMVADGTFELGAHTRFHSSLGALGRREVADEIAGGLRDLRDRLDISARLFAFPHGSADDLNETATELLAQHGVLAAFSTMAGAVTHAQRRAHGQRQALTLPRVVVREGSLQEFQSRCLAAGGTEAAAPQRPRLVVLSGSGAQNVGDDAMLLSTVAALKKHAPEAQITVLAEDPTDCVPLAQAAGVTIEPSLQRFVARDLPQRYPDTEPAARVLLAARALLTASSAVQRGEPSAALPDDYHAGLRSLLLADGVIDCGGANLSAHWKSYFYEKCLDYLLAPKPLFVTGQGIDRCDSVEDEQLLSAALARTTAVTLREKQSEAYLTRLRVAVPVGTTGDDAIDLAPAPPWRSAALRRDLGLDPAQPYLAVQYRHYLDHADDGTIRLFGACIDAAIAATGLPVLGIPMHFAGTDEREHLDRLVPAVAQRSQFHRIDDRLTPSEAKALFGAAQLAFGISYHSGVFALSSGVPYLGLYRGAHYGQKMHGLAERFGFPELPLPLDRLDPEQFGRLVVDLLARREAIAQVLHQRTAAMLAAVDTIRGGFVDVARRKATLAVSARPPAVAPPTTPPAFASPAIDWGGLRSLSPVSTRWGFDRGTPIDRVFIERFLTRYRAQIRGSVAELLNADYAQRFAGGPLTRIEIIDVDPTNKRATLLADLTVSGSLPREMYDTFILTQTLPYLRDPEMALRECYAALRPGGMLLATVPSIIKFHREPEDHWRFTLDSMHHLVSRSCPGATAEIEAHGNLIAAIAFLIGAAAEELSPEELAHTDVTYAVTITAAIQKPDRQ